MEPEQLLTKETVTIRGGVMLDDTSECYYYFCLKNGARKTAFRVNKSDVNSPDIDTHIKTILSAYPQDTEIYPITKEEHDIIRKNNSEIRRIFNKARRRSVIITNDYVIDTGVESIADKVNELLG